MLRFVNKLCSGVLTMHAHATDLRDSGHSVASRQAQTLCARPARYACVGAFKHDCPSDCRVT